MDSTVPSQRTGQVLLKVSNVFGRLGRACADSDSDGRRARVHSLATERSVAWSITPASAVHFAWRARVVALEVGCGPSPSRH